MYFADRVPELGHYVNGIPDEKMFYERQISM